MSTHKLSSVLKYPLEIKFNTDAPINNSSNEIKSYGMEKSEGIFSKFKDPMVLYTICILLPIIVLYIFKPSFIMSTVNKDRICTKKILLWSFIISFLLCSLLYFETYI